MLRERGREREREREGEREERERMWGKGPSKNSSKMVLLKMAFVKWDFRGLVFWPFFRLLIGQKTSPLKFHFTKAIFKKFLHDNFDQKAPVFDGPLPNNSGHLL